MKGNREDGFTLIELLVAIVILGAIVGAIGTSIVVGLRTTDTTTQRLSESHDAQMATSWFGSDVQSAGDVTLNAVDACSGGTALVALSWTDAGIAKVASYFVRTTSAEKQLVRAYCAGSAPKVETVIAHRLLSTGSVAAACVPAATCTGAHPWKPQTVTISVTDESGYAYTISASRRSTV
jgi:prepilin-type N-terminal cleavage/methylation domain-containing protein